MNDVFHSMLLAPGPWILVSLRLVHFAGILLGVGAATLLDFIILRFVMLRVIQPSMVNVVAMSAKIITLGLVLLWVSGIGFLIYYWFFDPGKIDNPKLVAKVIIVAVLSINAFLVHYFLLPKIGEQIGHQMLEGLSHLHCTLLLMIATISAVSWYVPLILGIVPQFNKVVPAELILADYAILLVTINLVVQFVLVIYFYGTDSQKR